LRISAGRGYTLPTPFIDETEAVGFSRVLPVQDLQAERAGNVAIDAEWTIAGFELGNTLFLSRVTHPLVFSASDAVLRRFEITNSVEPTDAYGSQLFARARWDDLRVLLAYTYLRSTEGDPDASGRRSTPLTPTHSGEFTLLWENEKWGRVGGEVSFTDVSPSTAIPIAITVSPTSRSARWGKCTLRAKVTSSLT
jgi:hypothetical protein